MGWENGSIPMETGWVGQLRQAAVARGLIVYGSEGDITVSKWKPSHSQSLLSAIPPGNLFPPLPPPPKIKVQPNNPCTSIKTDENLILSPQCKCIVKSFLDAKSSGTVTVRVPRSIIKPEYLSVYGYDDKWERFFTPSSEQVVSRDGGGK